MILFQLAIKSLRNRLFSSTLTVVSIALSVALLLAVERTKRAGEEGFTQAISQTDLLVGARTGPLNLILYTVFNMGSPSNNVSWKSFQEIKAKTEIEWTIPYSIGDSHRGFRVVGTDENFYAHYSFHGGQKVLLAEGTTALGIWDAVIGSNVKNKLGYALGEKIVIAHGVTHGEGVLMHDDKPFHVTGVLRPTGTVIDQGIYVSLYGIEAMHLKAPATEIKKEDIRIDDITSFFLRLKSRTAILNVQRDINNYPTEPLLAIIPGVALSELWRSLSQIDNILKMISWMVIGVGLAAMLSSLLAGLNERRREMAILRSLGAGPTKIAALMIFESGLLTLIGIALGLGIEISFFFVLQAWLENNFGFYMTGFAITKVEIIYLAVTLICGLLIGLVPALKASNSALKDGLSSRV
jgi:putative ABC transport system permease protein